MTVTKVIEMFALSVDVQSVDVQYDDETLLAQRIAHNLRMNTIYAVSEPKCAIAAEMLAHLITLNPSANRIQTVNGMFNVDSLTMDWDRSDDDSLPIEEW